MQIQSQPFEQDQDPVSLNDTQPFAFSSDLSLKDVRLALASRYQGDVWRTSTGSARLEFYPLNEYTLGFTLYKPQPGLRPYVAMHGQVVNAGAGTMIHGEAQLHLGSAYMLVRGLLAFLLIVLFTSSVYDMNLIGVMLAALMSGGLLFVDATIRRQLERMIDALQDVTHAKIG